MIYIEVELWILNLSKMIFLYPQDMIDNLFCIMFKLSKARKFKTFIQMWLQKS